MKYVTIIVIIYKTYITSVKRDSSIGKKLGSAFSCGDAFLSSSQHERTWVRIPVMASFRCEYVTLIWFDFDSLIALIKLEVFFALRSMVQAPH